MGFGVLDPDGLLGVVNLLIKNDYIDLKALLKQQNNHLPSPDPPSSSPWKAIETLWDPDPLLLSRA